MKILETWEDAASGQLVVMVEGRKRPVRLHARFSVLTDDWLYRLTAAAIEIEKASQIIPDNRHDRGWPKVAA